MEFLVNGENSNHTPEEKKEHLNLFLNQCVKEEEYEYAAIVRDYINKL